MAASTDDMINQLQAQLATPPSPSFLGVTAQPDPSGLQALLMKLKQQQFLQQASQPTGGRFGYLHDAGKQAFTDVGQQLGTALGGGLNQAAAAANPAPPAAPSPQAAQGAAITQASRAYQAMIANNVPENQARQNAAQMLVAAGVPNAADALAKATQQGLEDKFKSAETAKDVSQGQMDQDTMAHRLVAEDQESQRIALEKQRIAIEKTNSDNKAKASDLDAPASPGEMLIAKKMAAGDMALPNPGSRSPQAARYANLALQINPDLTQETYPQRVAAYKAIGSGKDATTLRSFNVVYDHLDTAQKAVAALNNGDVTGFNKLSNELAVATGQPAPTDVKTALQMIRGEIVKGVTAGAGGVADREKALAGVNENSSPAQLYGSFDTAKNLILGQVSGFKRQYTPIIGGDRFNALLDPRVTADLQKKEALAAATTPQGPSGKPDADGWTTLANGVRIRQKAQ